MAMSLCRTKIQTCIVNDRGQVMSAAEQSAYLELLKQLDGLGYKPAIMLYSLARPSMQSHAQNLAAAPLELMEQFGALLRDQGYGVEIAR